MSTAVSTAAQPSLASRVWRHVMLPLVLTWLAGTVVALGVGLAAGLLL